MTKKKQATKNGKWEAIESPLPAYPGTVSLPEHFTMPCYRAWKKVNDRLMEIEADAARYGTSMSYNGHDGFAVFDPLQWAHVLALADIRLENLPPEALADDTGESTPVEVLSWLIPLVRDDYLGEKLNLKNSSRPRTNTGQES